MNVDKDHIEALVKALELAEGRLALLLRNYPDESETCDHPVATKYVLSQVRAALSLPEHAEDRNEL